MRGFKITIFGIVRVSLDVRIVNVFVLTAIWGHLYPDFITNPFRHCVFRVRRSPRAPSTKVPVRL